MEGSIQKKGKIYYAVIALGLYKRKWFRGGLTKKDAQKVLTEKLRAIDKGTYRELPKVTFSEYADIWLNTYADVTVKPSTLRNYKNTINRLLKPAFSTIKLTDMTTGLLQTFISDRLKSVSPKTLKKVSAKTVINEYVVIKEMFKHACKWGYLNNDPSVHLDRPKSVKREIEILCPDEVDKVLSHASSHYKVAFLVDVMCGLRAGELWGLQWGDVDWNSKQIYVRRSLWNGEFQTPKSQYSIRKIDMTDFLVKELRTWKLACPISEDDLVFPSPEGKRSCHDNVIKRYFNPALRKAGLRHVSFHSLRHTNASMRIKANQNIKYIQKQMGHSSIQVTLDIYGHLFNDTDFNRQQAELFEDTFNSVRKPLETTPEIKEKGATETCNPLILIGGGERI